MRGHRTLLSVGLSAAAAALLCPFALSVARADAVTEPTPTPAATETVVVRFAGDLMVSKPMINGAENELGGYDFDYIWDEMRPELAGADIVVGNLETPVAGYDNGRYTGFPLFNAPDEYLLAVKNAGFTALTNANNHLLDRGVEGVLTTTRKIRALGFAQTGVYLSPDEERILMIDVRGVRLALLAYSYRQADKEKEEDADAMRWLTNFNDPAQMARDIARARELGADATLVFTHMGMEGTHEPSRLVREMARHLADSGADAAIFCHSHAVQPLDRIETVDGRSVFVAYALGNFLADGKYAMSRSGMLLELPVTVDRESGRVTIDNVRYLPTYAHGEGTDDAKRFTLYAAGRAMADETLPQRTRNLAKISWETVTGVVGETYGRAVRTLAQ